MSLKGLRFTLAVGGLQEMTTAVVSFRLSQHYSKPFQLKVDIASGLSDLTATDFLEKKRRTDHLAGNGTTTLYQWYCLCRNPQ